MSRQDDRSGKMGGAEAVARFKQYEYKAVSSSFSFRNNCQCPIRVDFNLNGRHEC